MKITSIMQIEINNQRAYEEFIYSQHSTISFVI